MSDKYIKEIFARADLQQFREFLVSEDDLAELDKRPYSERLEQESAPIIKRIKNTVKDDELDRVFSEFYDAVDEYREVYLEIGMKIGARMLFQLLCENES